MDKDNAIIHSTLDEGYDFFITDKWGEEHHFKISTFMIPSGLLSEAIEVIEESNEKEPRVYQWLSDYDGDIESAELRLKEKIKKGINIKYLTREYGSLLIRSNELVGRFLGDYFEIDGLKLTPEEFIQTFSAYEGFQFKMQFMDMTD